MLQGGMIFTDHTSRYVSTGHQVNLSYGKYLKSGLKCERYSTNFGVLVQAYHTENGIFNKDKFTEVIIWKGQNIMFCGVGAAHKNGVSENSINTVTTRAHAMMIYVDMRSP